MRKKLANPDARVAVIAARQHGVATVTQLLAAGLSHAGIHRRVRAGRLHRVHRGVYAVGHGGLTQKGRWKAATLACREGCALSHRSAAELWGMLEPGGGDVHVTVPGAGGRATRDGIRVHRSRRLDRAAVVARDNIPVTRPRQTLQDLRRSVEESEFRASLRRAEVLGLPLDGFDLACDPTESELERRFLALCRRSGIRKPETQVSIGRYRVDFLWRAERLVVETDGYRYHRGSCAFEADRARDNDLVARGYTVLRFTFRRIADEPAAVAALVRSKLR